MKLGFIGLGIMGAPMAGHLRAGGHGLFVTTRSKVPQALADAVTLERHPLLGRAKDIGSAAVMLSLLLAGAVWTVSLWP